MLLTKLQGFWRLTLLTLTIAFSFCLAGAQTQPNTIDIAAVQNNYILLPGEYRVAINDSLLTDIATVGQLRYEPIGNRIPNTGKLRQNINSKYIYVKFSLANRSDGMQTIYLYPGYYFKTFRIYRQSEAGKISMLPQNPIDANAYRNIEIAGRDSGIFYALLQPVKIQVNTFRPEMVHPSFLKLHFSASRNSNEILNIFTFILVGILCMMIIFSFSNYLFNGKKEFLYYSIYALFNAAILFLKAQLYLSTSRFNIFFEEYLDFMLLLAGLFFYMAFLRKFLSINPMRYPLLHKMARALECYIILSALGYSALYFFKGHLSGLELIEMIIKYIIVVVGLVFIVIGLKQRNKLINYIVLGNACFVIFGCISMTVTMAPGLQNTVVTHALFYYELGIIGEFSFFLLGLTYKTRMELINHIKQEQTLLKNEEKLEYEKQLAIMKTHQDERNRISADMHDELGGGMTAIRLLSELAKQRTNPEALPEIEKISVSANDLLGKMNAIIWSLKVSNDSLDNLVDYIKSFTHDFYENNNIDYTIETPEQIPAVKMSGIVRRNLFLSLKEISMLIRNEQAEKVTIKVLIEQNLFTLRIDFEGREQITIPENTRSMIRKRMDLISGRLIIDEGTGRYILLQIGV